MSQFSKTDRRSFVKLGALAATPVAALAPVAAMAADDSAARLARMQDERAIEGVVTDFLRRFSGEGDFSEFIAGADAVCIDATVRRIAEDRSSDPRLRFADDGRTATWQSCVEVEMLTHFEGDTTLEKISRFQGQGSATSRASRNLEAHFTRTSGGWKIIRLALA